MIDSSRYCGSQDERTLVRYECVIETSGFSPSPNPLSIIFRNLRLQSYRRAQSPSKPLCVVQNEPAEFHNLAAKPEHKERIAKMHAALVKELGEEPDETERRCRAGYARGYAQDDGKTKEDLNSNKKPAQESEK